MAKNPKIFADLKQKVDAFLLGPNKVLKEEVLGELLSLLPGATAEEVEVVRKKKREERGGFQKRIFLEEVRAADGSGTKYKKLVRDLIPEIILYNGQGSLPVTKRLSMQNFRAALETKLIEEIKEFEQSPSHEEAADVLEVLNAILSLK